MSSHIDLQVNIDLEWVYNEELHIEYTMHCNDNDYFRYDCHCHYQSVHLSSHQKNYMFCFLIQIWLMINVEKIVRKWNEWTSCFVPRPSEIPEWVLKYQWLLHWQDCKESWWWVWLHHGASLLPLWHWTWPLSRYICHSSKLSCR